MLCLTCFVAEKFNKRSKAKRDAKIQIEPVGRKAGYKKFNQTGAQIQSAIQH